MQWLEIINVIIGSIPLAAGVILFFWRWSIQNEKRLTKIEQEIDIAKDVFKNVVVVEHDLSKQDKDIALLKQHAENHTKQIIELVNKQDLRIDKIDKSLEKITEVIATIKEQNAVHAQCIFNKKNIREIKQILDIE